MAPVLVLTLSIEASVLACCERFAQGLSCPAVPNATLVPEAFYLSLTFDFEAGGKIGPGASFRAAATTGQDLPVKGKNLPGSRKFLPGLNQKNGAAQGYPGRSTPYFPKRFPSL
jgi:hypothetical protein